MAHHAMQRQSAGCNVSPACCRRVARLSLVHATATSQQQQKQLAVEGSAASLDFLVQGDEAMWRVRPYASATDAQRLVQLQCESFFMPPALQVLRQVAWMNFRAEVCACVSMCSTAVCCAALPHRIETKGTPRTHLTLQVMDGLRKKEQTISDDGFMIFVAVSNMRCWLTMWACAAVNQQTVHSLSAPPFFTPTPPPPPHLATHPQLMHTNVPSFPPFFTPRRM